MVVLCRGRLELQQPAIRTKVRRKLKMLTKLHFRNGISHQRQVRTYWLWYQSYQEVRFGAAGTAICSHCFFAHFADIALARPLMDSKKPTKLLDWRTDLVTGARNHRNSPLLPVAI
jgi:hypothetical protein